MDELLCFTDSALVTHPERSNIEIAREVSLWSGSSASIPLDEKYEAQQVSVFLEFVRKVRELGS